MDSTVGFHFQELKMQQRAFSIFLKPVNVLSRTVKRRTTIYFIHLKGTSKKCETEISAFDDYCIMVKR